MLKRYTFDIAKQMGVNLSKVVVVEGESVGCLGASLIKLNLESHIAEVLVYQSDLSDLENNLPCHKLKMKIAAAVSSLKKSLEKYDLGPSGQ